MPIEDEPTFTASDVKQASGLSYRQLNEWDRRGALPESRQADGGWRRFGLKGMFVLLVCAEIRNRFGTPLDRLKWLQDVMLQEPANHFAAAVEMMAHGLNVLLLTDFSETFSMSPDVDIGDLFYLGMARTEDAGAFVVLKVNPLVNKILSTLKEPIELKLKDDIYRVIYGARGELRLRSRDELEVLRLIRSGEYARVVIKLADGKIVRADAESEHVARSAHELADLLRDRPFQTVTVTQQNGHVIKVTRNIPNVLADSRARRGTPERRVSTKK